MKSANGMSGATSRVSTDRPLHQQISTALRQQVADGQLPPGTMLPPELELARRYGVSRHTMRAALNALVHEGLIERQRGKGTVVTRPRIQQNLARFYSLAREMRQRGLQLETRVLARGRCEAGDELGEAAAAHLGVPPGEVGYLLRLRLTEGTPFILEHLTFPVAVCPILIEPPTAPHEDPGAASFYDMLVDHAHLTVTLAHETFRPVVVTGYEARLLGIATGTAVFDVERTGHAGERIVEWRHSLVRSDRYVYAVDLLNPAEDAAFDHDGASTYR